MHGGYVALCAAFGASSIVHASRVLMGGSDVLLLLVFVAATGLTRDAVRQIGRARQAAVLLHQGLPVHQVVYQLGYFDQPHLARSLTRYIGRTVTQLRAADPAEPLSLLYKT